VDVSQESSISGVSVEFLPVAGDCVLVLLHPVGECEGHVLERSTEGGEFVLDPRWHLGVDGPRDKPVALECSQGHGQHSTRDTRDDLGELGESSPFVAEHPDHQERPLVAHARQQRPEEVRVLARAQLGHRRHRSVEPVLQCLQRRLIRHIVSDGHCRVTGGRLR
jgi:hypothetical protein